MGLRRKRWLGLAVAAAAVAAAAAAWWATERFDPGPASPSVELPDAVPVWAISLARRPQRRQRLQAQAPEVQFIDAVDGLRLQTSVPDLTRGELGCFYSHVGVWLRLANSEHEVALVLEDDADIRLPEQWDAIRAAAGAAPAWDILFLGHTHLVEPAALSPGVHRVHGDVWGLQAMLVTKAAAVKLLDAYGDTAGKCTATGKNLPVDVWLSRQPGVRLAAVVPSMVPQRDLSDSETQRVR